MPSETSPTAKAPDISIQDAAKEGNIKAIKQHIAAGTDVNAKGDGGLTPLLYATGGNYKKIVELLIAKGADVNAKDNRLQKTPLDVAIMRKHAEIADLLRKHGGKASE